MQKKQVTCYVCNKHGHKAYRCFHRKNEQNGNLKSAPRSDNPENSAQANLAKKEDIIPAVVVEANLMENKIDWMLDTRATRHPCANKEFYHYFKEVPDGDCVYMGNSSTVGVLSKGKILLKLTSRKNLVLNDVLYVPSLRRNLISASLLNKARLKITLEAYHVVLIKNGEFVGKCRVCREMLLG